jgi:hypothetical protein
MHAVAKYVADVDSTFHRFGVGSEAIDYRNVQLATDLDTCLDVLQCVLGEPQTAK